LAARHPPNQNRGAETPPRAISREYYRPGIVGIDIVASVEALPAFILIMCIVPIFHFVFAPIAFWTSFMNCGSNAFNLSGSDVGGVFGSMMKMQPFVASFLCRSILTHPLL